MLSVVLVLVSFRSIWGSGRVSKGLELQHIRVYSLHLQLSPECRRLAGHVQSTGFVPYTRQQVVLAGLIARYGSRKPSLPHAAARLRG